MATPKIPNGDFGQWNMQRKEAKINKWQSSADLLQEKVDYVAGNIAQHQAALNYHRSKGFFRKLFTFAWFSIWWNNRKLKKFQRKSNEWAAHKAMLVQKQMIAQRKFEKKYGREASFIMSGRTNTRINEEGKAETRETLGRTKDQREIERAQYTNKQMIGKDMYLKGKSQLPGIDMMTPDGKFVGHYQHYNSIDRTVEIDTPPIKRGVFDPSRGLMMITGEKVVLKLNKNGELDLSLPENMSAVKNEDSLKAILEKHPEAYKTIPANYFGAGVDRNQALNAVKTGLQTKIAFAATDKDGNTIVDAPQKDSSGKVTGKNASPREFAQQIYQDVIEKDRELENEAVMTVDPSKRTNMTTKKNNAATRRGVGTTEVNDFFGEATR